MTTMTEEEQRKWNVVYGYMTSGNSIWALIEQIVGDKLDDHYNDIVKEINERVGEEQDDPESMTFDEELEYLEQLGKDDAYSYNTVING